MQIVIEIPKKVYNALTHMDFDANLVVNEMRKSIANGTPQPKTEVLDKIRAEIDTQDKWLAQAGYNAYNVDIAFNSIKRVIAESEE